MSLDFIEQAQALVNRLHDLDQRRVVFGASRHNYAFNPCIAIAEVEALESTYQVALPIAYRRYLTELGNGGAGPLYGIFPFDPDATRLREPFPHTQAYELGDEDNPMWNSPIPGTIVVAEYGCGMYVLLIVRGEAAGQVWFDARYEGGISPILDEHSSPLSFDTWWLRDMGKELALFERIQSLMNAATSHEDIHTMLEPGILQLTIDEIMLSLMNQDPHQRPRKAADKPWGDVCGLVEDHYAGWLQANCIGKKQD